MLNRVTFEQESRPSPRPSAASQPQAEPLPLDLRQWIRPEVLWTWIEEEIAHLNWDHPLVHAYLRNYPDLRAKVLLKLLVGGCATQVFATAELISRCRTDPYFVNACEGRVPFAHELRSFRRKNRRLVVKILGGVFCRAMQASGRLPTGSLERAMEDRANARLDMARHMDDGNDD